MGGWTDWDSSRGYEPYGECDHWTDAWKAGSKSDEQELAEELNWDTTGFLTDFYDPFDAVIDPRIDDDFIIYIYNTACCQELQDTRDMLLTSTGFDVFTLRTNEEF